MKQPATELVKAVLLRLCFSLILGVLPGVSAAKGLYLDETVVAPSLVTLIAIGALMLLVVAVAFYVIYRMATRHYREGLRDLRTTYLKEVSWVSEAGRVSAEQKRRAAFQAMRPKTFYYLDERQVKDLYPQVPREPEPVRIETKETKDTTGAIAAKLPVEPRYERSTGQETKRFYEVEPTLPVMYNRIEEYLVEKGQVAFGLEDFEFDESEIDHFNVMCEEMRLGSGFRIPDVQRSKFVFEKKKNAAEAQVKRLSTISGYVMLQAEFLVSILPDGDYVLSYTHSLNEFLHAKEEGDEMFPPKKVSIQLTCTKEYITPSGTSTMRRGHTVRIVCLGKAVGWSRDEMTLSVSPITIY